MTETTTLRVTMVDVGGNESTFKLENPSRNLTLAQVRSAFNSQFDTSTAVIMSSKNEYFTAVNSAYYETVARTNLS